MGSVFSSHEERLWHIVLLQRTDTVVLFLIDTTAKGIVNSAAVMKNRSDKTIHFMENAAHVKNDKISRATGLKCRL